MKELVDSLHVLRYCNYLETTCGCEFLAQREGCIIRRRIDHGHANVAHITSQRVPEQNDLHERHQQENRQRLPVAQNVTNFLGDEGAKRGDHDALASLTKSSSMLGTFHCSLSARGVPIVAMRPSTMMEIRSQYSASSM